MPKLPSSTLAKQQPQQSTLLSFYKAVQSGQPSNKQTPNFSTIITMPSNPDSAKGLPGGHPDPLRSHPFETAKTHPASGKTNKAPAYDLETFMKEHPHLTHKQCLVLLTGVFRWSR